MIYIGALKPSIPQYKFLNSLFKDPLTNQNFVAKVVEEKIIEFTLIEYPFDLLECKEKIEVNIGQGYIFSFVAKDTQLIYGSRDNIERNLLPLLNSEINVHTKLMIASFLNLFSKYLDLVSRVNEEFSAMKISSKINDDNIFKNKIRYKNKNLTGISDRIVKKIETFKDLDTNIQEEDVFFFYDDKIYFENNELDAADFILINKESDFKIILSKTINVCSDKNKIDINKLSRKNNKVYKYLLFSEEIFLEQQNIEQHLTHLSNVEKQDFSIIDIGLKVDKQFDEFYKHEKHIIFDEEFELLEKTTQTIIQNNTISSDE